MRKKWKSFEDARKFVHDLALKSQREWRKYARKDLSGTAKDGRNFDLLPEKPDVSFEL